MNNNAGVHSTDITPLIRKRVADATMSTAGALLANVLPEDLNERLRTCSESLSFFFEMSHGRQTIWELETLEGLLAEAKIRPKAS